MPTKSSSLLSNILKQDESQVLESWVQHQLSSKNRRADLMKESDIRRESAELLKAFRNAVATGEFEDTDNSVWAPMRDLLADASRSRVRLGFSSSDTATFVLSLKQPLFQALQKRADKDPDALAEELWHTTVLLDKLALYTTESYQKSREEIISRQQHELLELSTPVVKLWDGILALPLIGTLDSERTQIVMESLLQRIVETGAAIAIIDITGVPTVDTLVAQHLLKTVAAGRLMGADCIISGIRPQIAATIVHLGVDLSAVITKASLADAFALALGRMGLGVAEIDRKRQERSIGTDTDS
ncbi:MAG TPA: STAS domain-containing protein [Bryobacteraceae bacterium]|jgi:rsbT co-antagonist protein RsbR